MINDRAKGRESWLGAAGGDTADAKSDSGTRASDLVASHVSWDQVFGGLSGPLILSLGNHQYHARCTKHSQFI